MPLSDSFEQFRQELGEKVNLAEELGVSADEIRERATEIGEWLSDQVDPQNREQRLLQELWRAADHQEREALAGAVVKMVQHAHRR